MSDAQRKRIFTIMLDGQWHTLRDMHKMTRDPEASISARLRDFRKPEFGGHKILRRRYSDNRYGYRLVPS